MSIVRHLLQSRPLHFIVVLLKDRLNINTALVIERCSMGLIY